MLFWPHNTILALTGSPKITTAALHLVGFVLGLHFIRPIWEEALDEDPLLLGALNQSHSEIRGVFAETKLGSSSAVDLFKLQLHNANYEGQQTGAPPPTPQLQMSALVWLSQRDKFHLTCRCMWSKIKSKTRDLTHTHTHTTSGLEPCWASTLHGLIQCAANVKTLLWSQLTSVMTEARPVVTQSTGFVRALTSRTVWFLQIKHELGRFIFYVFCRA